MPLIFLACYLFLFLHIWTTTSIGPENYITIQYGEIISQKYDDDHIVLKLPCTANIGSCNFDFISHPPDWITKKNGQMILPVNYTNSQGYYALTVNISEPTGEYLIKNLIIESSIGNFRFQQAQNFYQDLQYSPKSRSRQNISQRKLPSGSQPIGPFPSYDQVIKTLQSENFLKIVVLLSTVMQTDAQCSLKKAYYDNLLLIINNQRAQNAGKIYFNQLQIQKLEEVLNDLKRQQQVIANTIIEQKQKLNKQLVLEMKDNLSQTFYEYLSYSIIATNYRNKLKQKLKYNIQQIYVQNSNTILNQTQLVDDQNTTLSLQIEQLKYKINKKDQEIAKLYTEKYQLQTELLQKQFQLLVHNSINYQQQTITQIQQKFRQYSQKAIRSKIKYQQIQYQYININSEIQLKQTALRAIISQIDQVQQSIQKQKNSQDNKLAEQLRDVNLILENNQKSINKQLFELQCTGS